MQDIKFSFLSINNKLKLYTSNCNDWVELKNHLYFAFSLRMQIILAEKSGVEIKIHLYCAYSLRKQNNSSWNISRLGHEGIPPGNPLCYKEIRTLRRQTTSSAFCSLSVPWPETLTPCNPLVNSTNSCGPRLQSAPGVFSVVQALLGRIQGLLWSGRSLWWFNVVILCHSTVMEKICLFRKNFNLFAHEGLGSLALLHPWVCNRKAQRLRRSFGQVAAIGKIHGLELLEAQKHRQGAPMCGQKYLPYFPRW